MEKKIAVYNRISKGKNISRSIEAEYEVIKNYANRNNVKIMDIYRDVHKSTEDDRIAYNRLITHIFEGKVNSLVILSSIERLSRNINIIDRIKKFVEVQVVDETGKSMPVVTDKDFIKVDLKDWLSKSFGIDFKGGDDK